MLKITSLILGLALVSTFTLTPSTVSAIEFGTVSLQKASEIGGAGYRRPGRFFNRTEERSHSMQIQLELRRRVKESKTAQSELHESRNTALRSEDAPIKKINHGGLSLSGADRSSQRRWGQSRPSLRSGNTQNSFFQRIKNRNSGITTAQEKEDNTIEASNPNKKLQYKNVSLENALESSNRSRRAGLGAYTRRADKASTQDTRETRDSYRLRDASNSRRAFNGRGSSYSKARAVDKDKTNLVSPTQSSYRKTYRTRR